MRFGAFITPNHRPDDDPTLALERDLQLVEHLMRLATTKPGLGSTMAQAGSTSHRRRRLLPLPASGRHIFGWAQGVAGLPFHHPLMLADRMLLLNHLSRGRAILGTGPAVPRSTRR